jgi:hypothetical protein
VTGAAHPGSPRVLEHLADALDRDEFATVMVTTPGRRPCLMVARRATLAAEHIYADDSGWFWWSWAERIAATSDPIAAAYQITAALRGGLPGGGQQ